MTLDDLESMTKVESSAPGAYMLYRYEFCKTRTRLGLVERDGFVKSAGASYFTYSLYRVFSSADETAGSLVYVGCCGIPIRKAPASAGGGRRRWHAL